MPDPIRLPEGAAIAVHDCADALLRDPQTPEYVRTLVSDVYNVVSYLDKVEFRRDDDGYVTVHPAGERPVVEDVEADVLPDDDPAADPPPTNANGGNAPA